MLCVLAACTRFAAAQEHTGQTHQPLIESPGTKLWTQNANVIPMCWHQLLKFSSAADTEAAKNFVINTIQDGWINQLNLRTTWVTCPATGPTQHVRVKLRIGDGGYNGTTLALGMGTLSTAAQRINPPPNDPPGLLIGFRSDWNTNESTRRNFRSLILHEFGHVLGFAHEQLRPDPPPGSSCYSNPLNGGIKLGPVDPKSIMGWSYCNTALGVVTLNDTAAARSVYGRGDVVLRGVDLLGRFRTHQGLSLMSTDDMRNTLIVELAGRTNQTGSHFQAMNTSDLSGTGAVLAFLREAHIRADDELKRMSDDDRRNTLIVEVDKLTGQGSALQGLNNMDLVLTGLGRSNHFIRGVLLAGKFRSMADLRTMSAADQSNTLIVELSNRSKQTVSHYQGLNDEALAGAGAALVFLRETHIRSDADLKAMNDDDQRNTLIAEVGKQTGLDLQLQGLNTLNLITMTFGRIP